MGLALGLGLAGGFLVNVVATRLAANHPLLAGLRCTRSGHPLGLRQYFPVVGFLAQRGRCSTCGKPLSLAYPLVEAATALLVLALCILEGFGVSFWFHSLYTVILMLVLVTDWKHRDIYLSVIAVGGLAAFAGSFYLPG